MAETVFIILSFEGPDRYSHAGGLGSRIRELSTALAGLGHETHLFFVGDPELPATETLSDGKLHLHRWCQWISSFHPGGVYDGEDGKLLDWSESVPAWLSSNLLPDLVAAGKTVVVLAEEWQTVGSVVGLGKEVERNGWSDQVHIFWNLNNLFGTGRIDWGALRQSAVITTVSRYMKHVMWRFGTDARVVPNGISDSWFPPPPRDPVTELRRWFKGKLALSKIARWDPDKRWKMAMDGTAILKKEGMNPVLIARGSNDPHGVEVLAHAEKLGLTITTVPLNDPTPEGMIRALKSAGTGDVMLIRGYLNQIQLKVLYRASDAVLANSGVEPFGLVGLEVMAAGGLAFIGSTGEDYATPGYDCISVQTDMPAELAYHAMHMKSSISVARAIRNNGRRTARRYAWNSVIERTLIPMIQEMRGQDRLVMFKTLHPASASSNERVPGNVAELTEAIRKGSVPTATVKVSESDVMVPGYTQPWAADRRRTRPANGSTSSNT